MNLYIVTSKATNLEVYRYNAEAAVEWSGMAFDTHTHTQYIAPDDPVVATVESVKVWAPIDFLRQFTMSEQVAIRTAAKSNMMIESFLAMLNLTVEVHGNSAEVLAALGMFEQAGLIGTGRAAEILS